MVLPEETPSLEQQASGSPGAESSVPESPGAGLTDRRLPVEVSCMEKSPEPPLPEAGLPGENPRSAVEPLHSSRHRLDLVPEPSNHYPPDMGIPDMQGVSALYRRKQKIRFDPADGRAAARSTAEGGYFGTVRDKTSWARSPVAGIDSDRDSQGWWKEWERFGFPARMLRSRRPARRQSDKCKRTSVSSYVQLQ